VEVNVIFGARVGDKAVKMTIGRTSEFLLVVLIVTVAAHDGAVAFFRRPTFRSLGVHHVGSQSLPPSLVHLLRGGDQAADATTTIPATPATTISDSVDGAVQQRELSLDEKVHAAMLKLGLRPPMLDDSAPSDSVATVTSKEEGTDIVVGEAPRCNEVDGVCEMPNTSSRNSSVESDHSVSNESPQSVEAVPESLDKTLDNEDAQTIALRISQSMKVDISMVWAALGATSGVTEGSTKRVFNEQAARDMIQMELDMISQIDPDSENVQVLVQEGYQDTLLVRRALAFADGNIDNARAILLADKMDEEEDQAAAAAAQQTVKEAEASFKTVKVAAGFDPAKIDTGVPAAANPDSPPKPAPREAVIFEATTAQVQELVLESPVPVLLDIYADWCGPCKALSPILEEMAMKGGGMFRLVKVNSDNERPISQALDVTALPTIYGIRDGKVLHMFQGMPKSEEMMKNFLMGLLIPGQSFSPPVTAAENQKYAELSAKLLKVAGSAAFSFSARERLHDKVSERLEELVIQTGDVFLAEQSASTIRSLISNILRDPYELKFRTLNLVNSVIASRVARYPACMTMLRGIGFVPDGKNKLSFGKSKAIVNVAPLYVAREAIDKWIDKTRYEVARAGRKRRDEADRLRIQAELAAKEAIADEEEENEEDSVDPNMCTLSLRIDGKKKVHEVVLSADEPLSAVLSQLPGLSPAEGEFQITCVAKRLVVKSTNVEDMSKSLREYGLMSNAAIVVRATTAVDPEVGSSFAGAKLAERAASKKKSKKGTHTMQSIGIYAKDDNAKGELVDGGGGTLYEQDVSDDEGDVERLAHDQDDSNADNEDLDNN
jgi:thioredoxin 1